MSGLTNQTQRSACLTSMSLAAAGKRRGNLRRVSHFSTQLPVRDLSVVNPEAVQASSERLGWQNLRAIHMRQRSEWTMPPLETHCIIIQLGPALTVSAQIDRYEFEQIVQTGDVTIVPAGMSLHWQQRDARVNEALHLYLHPNVVRSIAQSINFDYANISIEPQFAVSDEQIHHVSMCLHCELKDANVIGRVYADSLARVLAMQLVRRYSYLKNVQLSRGGMAPGKLRKAIEFINANLDVEQAVAVAAVAEEVEMSYFHFSRAFKQATGVSPHVYSMEQRIERAKKLLSETDLSITEIAMRLGFASQSHFTTTFRRLAWTTPRAFRNAVADSRAGLK